MPQTAEATANQTIPMEKIRLRPKRSPSEPPRRRNAASVSEYPVTTHCSVPTPPWKVAADGGERDADDGRIEEGDARAEDRGRDHPAAPPARERQGLGRGGRRGRTAGVGPGAHWGQACMVRATVAPGWSTEPAAGLWVRTRRGGLTVVVVVVVVALPTE